MANYNKVILIGNLTRDPQLTYLPSQTPVVEFGLAVNRRWRGQDNQNREEVCFVDCRAYGKQAETINQYMAKGRQILIEGRLQLDTWEGKDGVKRSKHRVVVEKFTFLGSGAGGGGAPRGAGAGAPQATEGAPDVSGGEAPEPYDDGGEDIPF